MTLSAKAPLATLFAAFLLAETPGSAEQGTWHKGYFPNVSLVTQDGKRVRFYDDD